MRDGLRISPMTGLPMAVLSGLDMADGITRKYSAPILRQRKARELTALIEHRGKAAMIMPDRRKSDSNRAIRFPEGEREADLEHRLAAMFGEEDRMAPHRAGKADADLSAIS